MNPPDASKACATGGRIQVWRDKTLHAETHVVGSVPVCTAEGVVPASTVREKHAKGSVPACNITDINPETPVAICLV